MRLMRVGVKRVEYGYAYVDTDEVDPVEADYSDFELAWQNLCLGSESWKVAKADIFSAIAG